MLPQFRHLRHASLPRRTKAPQQEVALLPRQPRSCRLCRWATPTTVTATARTAAATAAVPALAVGGGRGRVGRMQRQRGRRGGGRWGGGRGGRRRGEGDEGRRKASPSALLAVLRSSRIHFDVRHLHHLGRRHRNKKNQQCGQSSRQADRQAFIT